VARLFGIARQLLARIVDSRARTRFRTSARTQASKNKVSRFAKQYENEDPDLFALRAMTPRGRLSVVVHLLDGELWTELHQTLEKISEPFDLFVTLPEGISDHLSTQVCAAFPLAQVFIFNDYGTDVYPFMALVNTGVFSKYEILWKLHLKSGEDR